VVASDNETQAQEVVEYAKDGTAVGLDIINDLAGLSNLVGQADVVISLLPVPMHPTIAKVCISSNTDLVTASYESEGIQKLHQW
jgi:alpha-aminoadipic semialdehyde synthase